MVGRSQNVVGLIVSIDNTVRRFCISSEFLEQLLELIRMRYHSVAISVVKCSSKKINYPEDVIGFIRDTMFRLIRKKKIVFKVNYDADYNYFLLVRKGIVIFADKIVYNVNDHTYELYSRGNYVCALNLDYVNVKDVDILHKAGFVEYDFNLDLISVVTGSKY